jgi:bile acid:Na+ symporter, BASS family
MYEALLRLDEIRLNFSPESLFVLNLTLAFIMFGVALEIKVRHFQRIIANPKAAVVGFISQFFLLPAITFLLIALLRNQITPTVALGMLLVASCPGGNISNFISSLAKGNSALSVSLTAIASISAIFMTPFNFAFWGGLYTNYISRVDADTLLRPLEINPVQMFQTVFILLGIPLIFGMWFNHKFQKATDKLVRPLKALSIIFFIAIVVLAFRNNFNYFITHITFIFIIVLLHNALALTSGYLFASLFKVKRRDRRALTIETGIQNSGLGLVLIFNPKIFPESLDIGGMAYIAAWWGIWHIIAGLSIAGFWSKIKVEGEKIENA